MKNVQNSGKTWSTEDLKKLEKLATETHPQVSLLINLSEQKLQFIQKPQLRIFHFIQQINHIIIEEKSNHRNFLSLQ